MTPSPNPDELRQQLEEAHATAIVCHEAMQRSAEAATGELRTALRWALADSEALVRRLWNLQQHANHLP